MNVIGGAYQGWTLYMAFTWSLGFHIYQGEGVKTGKAVCLSTQISKLGPSVLSWLSIHFVFHSSVHKRIWSCDSVCCHHLSSQHFLLFTWRQNIPDLTCNLCAKFSWRLESALCASDEMMKQRQVFNNCFQVPASTDYSTSQLWSVLIHSFSTA